MFTIHKNQRTTAMVQPFSLQKRSQVLGVRKDWHGFVNVVCMAAVRVVHVGSFISSKTQIPPLCEHLTKVTYIRSMFFLGYHLIRQQLLSVFMSVLIRRNGYLPSYLQDSHCQAAFPCFDFQRNLGNQNRVMACSRLVPTQDIQGMPKSMDGFTV